MMKIATVVGARPQFVKAAALSRALSRTGAVVECMIHTGQHFDERMSKVFFDELQIEHPAYNLGISGGRHGVMTGRMLGAIEEVLVKETPDVVVVYGDTNSTLAGALAAAKLHLPVAHVEAGLRSFNTRMPEEINRVLTDRISKWLLCPTDTAVRNLCDEGLVEGVVNVGDVMFDAALHFGSLADERRGLLGRLQVRAGQFALATCHREENTDNLDRLSQVLSGLASVAEEMPVILPLHPRTRDRIRSAGLEEALTRLLVIEPISFLDMVCLEKNAAIILTDSGGVQKEAFFFRVPCVTMRDETEWVETVESGWNLLAGADALRISAAVRKHEVLPKAASKPYGNGDAAERICELLLA